MEVGNLFKEIPADLPEEIFDCLVDNPNVKIERIISYGHSSPKNFWYDQAKNEWVILLSGSAVLSFEDEKEKIYLLPGDYILIPSHKRHRVEKTDKSQKTIWLAVHF